MFWRLHKSLESSPYCNREIFKGYYPLSSGKLCYMRAQIMYKSGGGRRPKKKIYYREPDHGPAEETGDDSKAKSLIESQKH
jgi:hypothetical protein